MLGNDIFVAFKNKKTALTIAKIAITSGYNVSAVLLSASDLKKTISYYDGGIIICGCHFNDDNINSLIDAIPPQFKVIVVGSVEQLGFCDSQQVFKLAVPLNKADLICYIDMFANSTANSRRTDEEQRIISKAKRFLISHYHMTEPQAHHYLEKKSMDTGLSIVAIARKIVD